MKVKFLILASWFFCLSASFPATGGAESFVSVKPVLEQKCAVCHAVGYEAPGSSGVFLFNKIAGTDKKEATGRYDMRPLLDAGDSSNIAVLKPLEHVIRKNSMPPNQYRIFHPSIKVTEEERAAILQWLYTVKPELKVKED